MAGSSHGYQGPAQQAATPRQVGSRATVAQAQLQEPTACSLAVISISRALQSQALEAPLTVSHTTRYLSTPQLSCLNRERWKLIRTPSLASGDWVSDRRDKHVNNGCPEIRTLLETCWRHRGKTGREGLIRRQLSSKAHLGCLDVIPDVNSD